MLVTEYLLVLGCAGPRLLLGPQAHVRCPGHFLPKNHELVAAPGIINKRLLKSWGQ